MPLRLNVGASRKVTDNNYGSKGASVNLEIELDTALLQDTAKLQEKVRHVFGLVRTALELELNGAGQNGSNGVSPGDQSDHTAHANGHSSQDSRPRPATTAQVKALRAISRNHDVDLDEYLHRQFRVKRPDDLTIKQASVAIDELKAGGSVAATAR